MSFTEGNTTQVNYGAVVDALEGKVGSFIIFVWPESHQGPSASFSVSKNSTGIDWKWLSCVKDVNGVYIMPSTKGTALCIGLSDENSTQYTTFNVKILG